jgi:hypothetical protein
MNLQREVVALYYRRPSGFFLCEASCSEIDLLERKPRSIRHHSVETPPGETQQSQEDQPLRAVCALCWHRLGMTPLKSQRMTTSRPYRVPIFEAKGRPRDTPILAFVAPNH